jgi:hypothetical protein
MTVMSRGKKMGRGSKKIVKATGGLAMDLVKAPLKAGVKTVKTAGKLVEDVVKAPIKAGKKVGKALF